MSFVKKAVKKVGRFVKKHWKKIAIAAAIVFTAGAATMGFAGMQAAFATKGIIGGLGAVMKGGALAIGKTIGIGKGAAAGAATPSAAVQSKLASSTAAAVKSGAAKAATTGLSKAAGAGLTKAAGSTVLSAAAPVAAKAAAPALMQTAGQAATGGFWSGAGGQVLLQGGLGAVSQLLNKEDEEEPQGYFGVGLNGNRSVDQAQLRQVPSVAEHASSFRVPLMYDGGGG
jgi:hypothetical protein